MQLRVDGSDGCPRLFRTFAGFHGLLLAQGHVARHPKNVIKQALRNKTGGKHDEHLAMLFRTFAV
jgi:hypothetical protein